MISEVFIKKIEWLDIEAEEADVCFTFKGIDYWAFSHPCRLVENTMKTVQIVPLILDEIEDNIYWKLNETTQYLKLVPNGDKRDSYLCFGKIISISPIVINYGDLEFEYLAWFGSNDKSTLGKYVYHIINRLDIIEP